MLGSWLSSVVHAAAPVAAVVATAYGGPAAGAAVYAATASHETNTPGAPAAPVITTPLTTAANPTGELILGGLALVGLVLVFHKKPAA